MKSLDIFADEYFNVRLNSSNDEGTYKPGNHCGGMLTIILIILPAIIFVRGILDIRTRNPALVDISVLQHETSRELLDETVIKFGSYKYSMNFFFSVSNDSVDLLNNGYFEVKAHLMDDNKTFFAR